MEVFEQLNRYIIDIAIDKSNYNEGIFLLSVSSSGKLPLEFYQIIDSQIRHYHFRVKEGCEIENNSYLIIDGVCHYVINRNTITDYSQNIKNIITSSFESKVVKIIEERFDILFDYYFEKKMNDILNLSYNDTDYSNKRYDYKDDI